LFCAQGFDITVQQRVMSRLQQGDDAITMSVAWTEH
jgi:hypothetical protein